MSNEITACGIPVICRVEGHGKDKCDFYEPIVVSEEAMKKLHESFPTAQQPTMCQHAGKKNSVGVRLCENAKAICAFVETLFPHLKCEVNDDVRERAMRVVRLREELDEYGHACIAGENEDRRVTRVLTVKEYEERIKLALEDLLVAALEDKK